MPVKEFAIAPSSEVKFEGFQNRDGVPHLFGYPLAASLAASQSATSNPSACGWSFSAQRNLASTTLHLAWGVCFVDQDVGIICIE